MGVPKLIFEQESEKYYAEAPWQYRREFQADPPMQLRIKNNPGCYIVNNLVPQIA